MRVGFLEGATYPDGTKVAMVAAINNFGAPAAGIPARPFFSSMVERNKAKFGDRFREIFAGTGGDAKKSLEILGVEVGDDLREAIIETTAPANSPVTDLLKDRFPTGEYGADDVWQAFADVANGVRAPAGKPLQWSGDMLKHISHEVE